MISFKKHFGLHICWFLLVKTNASVTCLFPAHVSFVNWSPDNLGQTQLSLDLGHELGPSGPHVFVIIPVSAASCVAAGRQGWFGVSTCSCSLKLHQPKQVLWSTPNSRGRKNISQTPWGQNEWHRQATISTSESSSKGERGDEYLLAH